MATRTFSPCARPWSLRRLLADARERPLPWLEDLVLAETAWSSLDEGFLAPYVTRSGLVDAE